MKTSRKESMRIIEEYEINPETMAILPFQYGTKIYSKVIEVNNQFISPFKPLAIIKKSCEFFGSSYPGRKEGTKHLIGVTHKSPIIIDSHTPIIALPTTSPSNLECIWLLFVHIAHFEKQESGTTVVVFRNNQKLVIPISKNSFNNQMSRGSRLQVKFMQNMEYMEQKYIKKSIYLWPKKASERRGIYDTEDES
ncbi:competence protein ComK [Bacillus chungangensis]|uniref:Competence protein ComK n=1 Tax=Bacillus chungangensis TaxID=587633 RepID=A0ABT9WN53_9BACI|nr:competence protein ComK [Bacillus chungangensis]MDQ0174718.1 competence protein ComK [Bacillus chungangensis]